MSQSFAVAPDSSVKTLLEDPGVQPIQPSIFLDKTAKNRHCRTRHFSHFDGTDKALITLVKQNFSEAVGGKFPDTLIVPVPPEGFFVIVPKADFSSDIPKPPANSARVILWSREKMQGTKPEEKFPPGEWGIVSIEATA